jgi:hypothetical protein
VSDEDSWESLVIWPCHILSRNLEIPGKTQFGHVFFIRLTIFQIPCKAYFGHVSLQELWVSHFNWIPETYDAYVALGICNQVEFIVLCQANNILEHTGNFLMISMTL